MTPLFHALVTLLLSLGGQGAIPGQKPDLGALLERGRAFDPSARKIVDGLPNVAFPHLRRLHFGRAGSGVVVGYGLRDEVWWPHAWAWDAAGIVGTCFRCDRSVGAIRSGGEAAAFLLRAAEGLPANGVVLLRHEEPAVVARGGHELARIIHARWGSGVLARFKQLQQRRFRSTGCQKPRRQCERRQTPTRKAITTPALGLCPGW
jgi:hypothetical protein